MAKHWADIEDALPPNVVAHIWREIEAGPNPPDTIPDKLRAFVEVAIDHPHYATAKDVAVALGETYNRINPIMHRIKDAARKARVCQ